MTVYKRISSAFSVGTPTVVSRQGFCLQTAHLESGVLARFARNSTILPNYWGREERQPHLIQPHYMLYKFSGIYIYKRRMISGNTHDSLGKSAELLMIGRRNTREHSLLVGGSVLGSNDPNTIPDPTRIRCSRFRIVSYASARTPLCLDLATIYVSSDSVTFRLRSLVTS